jgi:hypothetical protein
MIKSNVTSYLIISVLILSALSFTQNNVFAPSTIDVGTANNYAILSGSVITNGVTSQPITGNTGHVSTLSSNFTYTGLPLGTDHIGAGAVGTTGTLSTPLGDEHAALVSIGLYTGSSGNNTGLACTFSFANGTAVDLATDTTHGQVGQYARGVYCINGAASIGTAGINLNGSGSGQYIFKINGALTSVTQSHVTLSGGTLASDVFWAPVGGASLGANTSFQGTILSGAAAITLGANADVNQGRLISESAVTIEGGVHIITIPGGVTLSSIAITHAANKLSYTAGDMLNTTGLQITGTYSDTTTGIVIPDSVTGFDSSSPVTGQVLTVHVGALTTTYTINVVAAPVISVPIGTASNYAILSGNFAGVITNGVTNQLVSGNVGHSSTESHPFTFPAGFGDISNSTLGNTTTLGTPIGDAHAARVFIGNVTNGITHAVSSSGLACTFAFANGAVDLATDTTHGPVGVYTPGVYCIFGAPSIGTAGITLNGAGTYVFKSSGSLTTVPQSHVTLSGGADAANVFWAPSDASLGANTLFQGTILSRAGAITLGADADLNHGRLISESAVTILGGAHIITAPGVVAISLSSITITNPATKLSYHVGDVLNTAGLQITGIFSDGSTSVVTPSSVTGFNSTSTVTGQVLMVHVGSQTVTYTINVVATPLPIINLGNASSYVILSGPTPGTITNDATAQLISGTAGYNGGTSSAFTFAPGFSAVTDLTILGSFANTTSPFGAAHAARATIGTWDGTTNAGTACTFTFPNGDIDLGSNAQFPTKVYPPGVYCIDGILNINSGPITLSGNGAHIFKINGALNQAAGTHFILANGGQAANTFWVPIGATTLSANINFTGTILAGSAAITTGSTDTIIGRLISESTITIGSTNTISLSPALVAPDTTAPSVIIASPINGTVITHIPFTISGTSSDNISVDHVTVTIDGTPVTVTGTTSWSAPSGTLSNALHTITATAFDSDGNSASKTIQVTVNTVIINSQSVSVASATGKGSVSSSTDVGTFTSFTPVSSSTQSNLPSGVTFPYGLFSFTISVPFGQTVHVTQTYPSQVPASTKYWKLISGVWTDETSLISISGKTITLTLKDGGLGDSDGLQNGIISDPGGPSIPATPTMDLGTAGTFAILASTYTNTATGVVVNGDLGYTTGPAVNPVIFGTIHHNDATYSQAGSAQGTATSFANSQACTINLGSTIDLSIAQGGVYTPGVYCTTGAASIGGAGISLSGDGLYIFKIGGALTTVTGSAVHLNGVLASNVVWLPIAATTLAQNSNFAGVILDASGVTIGHNVGVTGNVLAFGGTVTTGGVDTFTAPQPVVAPLQFNMPSGSNSPSESRPSLGGVLLHTFSDGLRINGHVFDVSKFNNPVPQQVLPLDMPVSITIKQSMTRGSSTWQHAMLFMNFNGKDTTTGNADTWISIDKHDGVQVHDPNGFVTNVAIHNAFAAYDMNTTFIFTPVKQMSDSNMIIRVWDDRLSQTDAHVNGALVFGDVPATAAPMVKPDWIQVFTTMQDADNVIENAGFDKPVLFSHISTVSQVWTQANTGHVLWFYDTKDLQVARVIYDANGNVVGETVEPLINSTNTVMGKDTSYAGNHLSRNNSAEMTKALAQQQSNAQQTIDRLGYSR